MSLQPEYQWLRDPTIGLLPRVIQESLKLLGTAERVGRGSNPEILRWRDQLNAAGHNITGYGDDDIPWCGLFVAYVLFVAGKPVQKDPLWARNWAKYADPIATRKGGMLVMVPGKLPSLGDIMVYERAGGGGHVEFYIAQTDTFYIGIGGNKGNQVRIGPIEKNRCIAVRRPPMRIMPPSVRPYLLKKVGDLPTKNEA